MVTELVVVLIALRLVTVCGGCEGEECSGNGGHFVNICWETMCVYFKSSPSDYSTPFRLLVVSC